MKVTITRVFRGKQDTKHGEADKLGIKIMEEKVTDIYGKEHDVADRWLSTFTISGTDAWGEGDIVDIAVQEKNGYLNFKPATESLEERVKLLEAAVFGGRTEAELPQTPSNLNPDENVSW